MQVCPCPFVRLMANHECLCPSISLLPTSTWLLFIFVPHAFCSTYIHFCRTSHPVVDPVEFNKFSTIIIILCFSSSHNNNNTNTSWCIFYIINRTSSTGSSMVNKWTASWWWMRTKFWRRHWESSVVAVHCSQRFELGVYVPGTQYTPCWTKRDEFCVGHEL